MLVFRPGELAHSNVGAVAQSEPGVNKRQRVANKAKLIGRKQVFEIGSIVTPDTLLRWYRRPVAKKYEGSITRKSGRPKTASEIE